MPLPPIDLEKEAIQYEGAWCSRDDLAKKIRATLDMGDFNIGKLSLALEQLNQVLSSARTVAFRAQAEMADALTVAATRNNKTVGAYLRELILAANPGIFDKIPNPSPTAPEPLPVQPTVTLGPLPPAPSGVHPIPLIAGPGAMRAAGMPPPLAIEPTSEPVVELTRPKRKDP
ncbi:MAG: hypothetical protein K1X89_00485 [Myxococcaceae bacterium]|nr:hypothetical protein [Myxococcaceae bacterium]